MVASGINEFYKQASLATIELLQPDATYGPGMFISAVNQFYVQASAAMMSLLDLTNYTNAIHMQVTYAVY
jgi:hypothetical protein